MEQIGRRLFSVASEGMKRRLAAEAERRDRARKAGVKQRGRPRKEKA